MSAVKRTAIFTICSNNYIPFARILLESVRKYRPDADLFLCLADRRVDIPGLYGDEWTVVEAESLPIQDFVGFAFRYDIMEFNTAVKPFMFQHLLEVLDYDVALYFDPDIEVLGPLDAITTRLEAGASFVLTPHLCSPCEDAVEPNDITIMRAGIYNLGFLGAARGEETSRVLAWWARRLRYQCINAQDQGIFVDQKFMDMVPGFAPNAFISHDTTLNVAYWNLQQRRLELTGEGWQVDGAPLTFFHYSGFDPNQPSRLSKHETRFAADMPEPLHRLTARYASRLHECGYGTISGATYAYGHFASGTVIHHLVRKMFRDWHQYWPEDPFHSYEAFLHEAWPGASRERPNYAVTNFMKFLFDSFPSLNSRLDLANPAHVQELATWFVNHSATDLLLDLPLIEPAALRMGASRRPYPAGSGRRDPADAHVTVVGYLRTASGVGEAGRQTLLSLGASGLQVEGLDVALGVAGRRDDDSCDGLLVEDGRAPVQIFNVNADQLPLVVAHTAQSLRGGALRISIPFWELSRYPDAWVPAFDLVDEVWAPSRFIQAALAGRVDRPVIHMPVAIELTPPSPLARSRFNLPDGRFLFFFAFDFLSFMERKNPRAAIRAFREAFPRVGQAGLVLKCMNGAMVPAERAALQAEIGGHPDIFLLDETLNRQDTLGLIAASDAILSLHRSEGLGLLIAEAMLLGKPVIATGYSASREFVTPQTGYPVGYRMVPLAEGDYPFPAGQIWADPDVSHAGWLMRRLQQDPARAAPLVARARQFLEQNHSRTHVGAMQRRRLHAIGVQ